MAPRRITLPRSAWHLESTKSRRRRRSLLDDGDFYGDEGDGSVEDSLTAAGEPGDPVPTMPVYANWVAVAAFDDSATDDGRHVSEFTWRDGHHALKAGHVLGSPGSVIGHVEKYQKINGVVWAKGVYYNTPLGVQAAQMAQSGSLMGVSAEPGSLGEVWRDDNPDNEEGPVWRFEEYEIGALSQVDIPAFVGAGMVEITLAEPDEETALVASAAADEAVVDEAERIVRESEESDFGFNFIPTYDDDDSLTASASSRRIRYPMESFFLPEPPVPMKLTLWDDGSFAGHLAMWDSCHIGYTQYCKKPPRSKTRYQIAQQGSVLLEGGQDLRVARMSLGSGHAPGRLSPKATADFYEREAQCVGHSIITNGELGIWISGHANRHADDSLVDRFGSAAISGDWRRFRRNLELVAVLSVNTPGYTIPDVRAFEAAKVETSLVAAGAHIANDLDPAVGYSYGASFGRRPFETELAKTKGLLVDATARNLGMATRAETKRSAVAALVEQTGILV